MKYNCSHLPSGLHILDIRLVAGAEGVEDLAEFLRPWSFALDPGLVSVGSHHYFALRHWLARSWEKDCSYYIYSYSFIGLITPVLRVELPRT